MEMEKLSLTFEIDSPKIISTNEAYMHPVRKCKDGRYRSYVCKSPDLKEFQDFYNDKLKVLIPDDQVKLFQDYINESFNHTLEIYINYGIPEHDIYNHDASNLIKALEDCISVRLKIDDKKNSKVSVIKTIHNSFVENWKLKVTISTSKLNKYDFVY